MNKIVREHYPVEKLPEDLRELVHDASEVSLVITFTEATSSNRPPLASGADVVRQIRKLREQSSGPTRSMDEIVSDVRALRDEWED